MVAGSSSLLGTNIRKPCGGSRSAFWSVVAIFILKHRNVYVVLYQISKVV